MRPKTKYDEEANAAYITLKRVKPGDIMFTSEVSAHVLLDYDEGGEMVGIEVLLPGPSREPAP